jgi:hypothetical protein
MVQALRDEVSQQLDCLPAMANLIKEAHEKLAGHQEAFHKMRQREADRSPGQKPEALLARTEHCFEEMGRQGKSIQRLEQCLESCQDRITGLAQALASQDKSKAAPVSAAETPRDPDIIVSFVNFERVCRQMRAKCPHLFAATVRRACEEA